MEKGQKWALFGLNKHLKEGLARKEFKMKKVIKDNSQKESKKASKAERNIIAYLNSYPCIRENNIQNDYIRPIRIEAR